MNIQKRLQIEFEFLGEEQISANTALKIINNVYKEAEAEQLTLTDVVSCVCKIPQPRLKVSENGTHAYCNNCAKTYWQK